MSLLKGFRDVVRIGKRAVPTRFHQSTGLKTVYGRISLLQCASHIQRRSLFLGSASMNKFNTQGDQELARFLDEEIKLEQEAQVHSALPRINGFTADIKGSEVTLTRDYDGEVVNVKFNINNTVEDETPEEEIDDGKHKDLKSKPKFQVDLNRKNQVLTFLCSFVEDPQSEDIYEIEEFYIHDGRGDDSPTQYVASAGIIDHNLYNHFMNMLDDRGIDSGFANSVIDFSTAHEHKLYIKTLENIRSFLHS